MDIEQQVEAKAKTAKKVRRVKGASPTAQEIIDKAKREARQTTPAERVKIERAGQCLMPGHRDLPVMMTPISRLSEA